MVTDFRLHHTGIYLGGDKIGNEEIRNVEIGK